MAVATVKAHAASSQTTTKPLFIFSPVTVFDGILAHTTGVEAIFVEAEGQLNAVQSQCWERGAGGMD